MSKLDIRELLIQGSSFRTFMNKKTESRKKKSNGADAYVRAILQACQHKKKRNPCYTPPERKEPQVDDEMDRAWGYFVRTGDFSLVRDLRQQRELSTWFMNRWD